MPKLVKDIAAYGNLSVAVDSNKSIYVWGDCFGQKITTPLLTRFSTIHDAFAYTSMKAMHKPLFVADNEEDSLNIMESQGFGDLAMAFNDPVHFLLFFSVYFSLYNIKHMYIMLD